MINTDTKHTLLWLGLLCLLFLLRLRRLMMLPQGWLPLLLAAALQRSVLS